MRSLSGRRRGLLVSALGGILVAVVLGLLVWRERAALQMLDLRMIWPALVVGQVTMAGGLLLAAALWAAIMRALGSQVATLRHMNIYATTYLQRHLPGTIWYVLGRGLLYREAGDSSRLVTVASAMELMLTVMSGAVVTVTLLAGIGGQVLRGNVPAAVAAVLAVAAVSTAILHPATVRWAMRRLKLADAPAIPLRKLATWLGMYAVNWLIGGLIVYVNARALLGSAGAELPMGYLFFAQILVGTLSIFIFFLPSNFGLTEIGLSLLLSAVMPSSVAVLVAVLTRVLMVLYAAVGCLSIAAGTQALLRRDRHAVHPPAV